MRRYQLIQLLLLPAFLGLMGCSEPKTGDSPAQAQTSTPTASPAKSSTAAVDSPTPTPTQPQQEAIAPTPAPQAEVTAADLRANAEPKPAQSQPVEPTTAAAALRVLNLETFPKLKVKQEFDSQPMSIYYSTEGTVTDSDAFLMKELTKAGWKETKHLVTSTDQYVDRLLTKEAYHLRLSISTGGTQGEVAVNMALLGNFDVRTLPQTKDAEPQDSTPVMAGHRSSLSIPDAFDDLKRRMTEAGWQVVEEFHNPMADVPHYRSIHFRKNSVRVNLGFVKDPAKPAEKTNIFYHAESVIPIDLPMIDSRQPMKFDAHENRASIPWKGTRAELVELLTKQATAFGWQFVNADDYVQDKTITLYIGVGSPVGIAARITESAGIYYLSMERVRLPTKKSSDTDSEAADKIAETKSAADDAAAKKMKSEIQAEIAATDNAINKAINDELTKALGSLSTGASQADMQALQAKAAKIQAQLEAEDAAEEKASVPTKPKQPSDVLNVPDDAEPLRAEDKTIKATEARIKLGQRDIVLKHCLAYARMEDGAPTKIMFFSDKPLLADKLDKLCASGESFMIYDGFGPNRPDASLELRVSGSTVMMNFAADGLSIATNTSDVQSTVRLKNGKLQGRVTLEKPIELQSQGLTFEATIADKVRR